MVKKLAAKRDGKRRREVASPSELKTILHSKRANLYYLERCRVLVKGGRVEYVTDEGKRSLYWNIPIANTTCILLGNGTSITQAAMRELAKAGVLVGFSGGGGTPLYSANEADIDVAWFAPQSEYRPTQYLQAWVRIWFDDEKRLLAAKEMQLARLAMLGNCWTKRSNLFGDGTFPVDEEALKIAIAETEASTLAAASVDDLLLIEAKLTKKLYRFAAQASRYGEFTRAKKGAGIDAANRLLDHGNYLAYGLAATATWVLGLPHGFSVMHGKTRRGGLVFDVADLVKDALILPQAFVSGRNGEEDQEFCVACLGSLAKTDALDFMIQTIQNIAEKLGRPA